jgi:hypothetical protein
MVALGKFFKWFYITEVEMSYPTYYISSSIVSVDTSTESKIIMLPPALDTLEVKPIMILDRTGNASVNNIYLSTQIDNLMDNRLSTIIMSIDFQSLQIIPYSTTRYAITTNYTQGLSPYLYAIQVIASILQTGPTLNLYTYNSCAIANTGQIVLATATGGCNVNNGIYVSQDGGCNYTKVLGLEASNAITDRCCMSSLGEFMFVTVNTGIIYAGGPSGSWNSNGTIALTLQDVVCSSNGNNIATFGSDTVVYFASRNISNPITIRQPQVNQTITSIAMSGDGTKIYLGMDARTNGQPNVLIGNLGSDGKGGTSWTFTAGATDGPNEKNWTKIVCNSNGQIAYARTVDFSADALYKTTDSGVTWTLVSASQASSVGLISCDDTGNTLYIVSNTVGTNICFSLDGGTSFQEFNPSFILPQSLSASRLGGYFAAAQEYVLDSQGRVNTGQLRLT